MQMMKWMITLFAATALCAGSALAADPAAPVGRDAGKEDPAGHAMHDMKNCMEMGDKKCMEMGDKKCMEMGDKKCMEMHGKECNCCKDCMKGGGKKCEHHKGKKNRHKSHDCCDTMKGAAKSAESKPAENKPAVKESDGKDDTAKPAAMAAESVLSEAEGRALAQKSNCFACHSIEKKVVGPAWKDVAAKYRGDAGAEDRLIAKVSRGSSGVWGSVPMPANSPAVKDADIKALVRFALSLK